MSKNLKWAGRTFWAISRLLAFTGILTNFALYLHVLTTRFTMEQQELLMRDKILDAAFVRFSHFGLHKTTMNEIADDLAISKGLLYYYFPDKIRLFEAVLSRIIEGYFVQLTDGVKRFKSVLKSMHYYIDKRFEFQMQHYNLLDLNRKGNLELQLPNLMANARKREIEFLIFLLNRGNESKEFKVKDVQRVASLISNGLFGIQFSVIMQHPNQLFPNKEEFDSIRVDQKELIEYILHGLPKAKRTPFC